MPNLCIWIQEIIDFASLEKIPSLDHSPNDSDFNSESNSIVSWFYWSRNLGKIKYFTQKRWSCKNLSKCLNFKAKWGKFVNFDTAFPNLHFIYLGYFGQECIFRRLFQKIPLNEAKGPKCLIENGIKRINQSLGVSNEAEQLPRPPLNHYWSQLTWFNFQTIFNTSNKISSNQCFIEFLLTNFRKVSKFGVLCSPFLPLNFSEFLKNFLKNFQLFQNRKNHCFCTQISSKSLYRSKFGQIFP